MADRPLVLATTPLHPDAVALLVGHCDYQVASDTKGETLRRETAQADGLIVRTKLPDDVFAEAGRLRACVRHGVGLDFIPVAAATRAGIPVANLLTANTQSVVEHVVASALIVMRDLHELANDFAANGWASRNRHPGSELAGKTLGIVGCGHIGRGVAKAMQAGFGMKVIGCNRSPVAADGLIEQVSLDEVFRRADIVSLHVPSTPETRGIVDARRLALMAPGAVLINTGRGELVDDAALVAALTEGRIRGAAIDVFDPEPPPENHPFFGCPRLFLTPHTAGGADEALRRMSVESVEETIRILKGQRPSNLVNPEIWAAYLKRMEGRR